MAPDGIRKAALKNGLARHAAGEVLDVVDPVIKPEGRDAFAPVSAPAPRRGRFLP